MLVQPALVQGCKWWRKFGTDARNPRKLKIIHILSLNASISSSALLLLINSMSVWRFCLLSVVMASLVCSAFLLLECNVFISFAMVDSFPYFKYVIVRPIHSLKHTLCFPLVLLKPGLPTKLIHFFWSSWLLFDYPSFLNACPSCYWMCK